jgi:hypothetical protein
VVVPSRPQDFVRCQLRRQARRPQLKRDPLGCSSMGKHLSKSLKDVHGDLRAWVSQRPGWLQPPLLGALFVYGFVVWRGGLVLLPIAFVAFVFGSSAERTLLGRVLLTALVYAPTGGFLAGLLYSLVKPALRRLGAFGRYVQYILAAWAYFAVLGFFVVPVLRPGDTLSAGETWALSGVLGGVFGYVFATMDEDDRRAAQATHSQQSGSPKRDGAA